MADNGHPSKEFLGHKQDTINTKLLPYKIYLYNTQRLIDAHGIWGILRLNVHSKYGFTINISLALKGRVANHLKSVTFDPRKEGRKN